MSRPDRIALPSRGTTTPNVAGSAPVASSNNAPEFKGVDSKAQNVGSGVAAPVVDDSARTLVCFRLHTTEVPEGEFYDAKQQRVVACFDKAPFLTATWNNAEIGKQVTAGTRGALIESATLELESRDGTACEVEVCGLGDAAPLKAVLNGGAYSLLPPVPQRCS